MDTEQSSGTESIPADECGIFHELRNPFMMGASGIAWADRTLSDRAREGLVSLDNCVGAMRTIARLLRANTLATEDKEVNDGTEKAEVLSVIDAGHLQLGLIELGDYALDRLYEVERGLQKASGGEVTP